MTKQLVRRSISFKVVKDRDGFVIECTFAGQKYRRPRSDGKPFASEVEACANWRRANREMRKMFIEQMSAVFEDEIDLNEPTDCKHDCDLVKSDDGQELWCMECGGRVAKGSSA